MNLRNKNIANQKRSWANDHVTLFKKSIPFCLFFLLMQFFATAQKKNISIRIIQDQSVLLSDFETSALLKKKAFKIQVLLENISGVYVFASLKDSIYRFTESGPIRDFGYLPILEMKDDEFNEEKELRISETGWLYWFYDPASSWHSFNRKVIKLDSNRYVGTKYFKKIYDSPEGKEIKLKDINTPLYLFFLGVADYDINGKPSKELMRKKVKITWNKED